MAGLLLMPAQRFISPRVKGPDGPLGFSSGAGFEANLLDFFSCVYYSVVTFTLGYEDITP